MASYRDYQGIDLGRAANDAMNYRLNRERLAEIQRQRQIQTLLPEARAQAARGDFSLLYQINPQEAEAMKLGLQERAKSQDIMLRKQREESLKFEQQKQAEANAKVLANLETRRNALSYIAQNPASAPQVQSYIDGLAQNQSIDPFDVMKYSDKPEELKNDLEFLAFQTAMTKNPEVSKIGAQVLEKIGRAGDVSGMFTDEFKSEYEKMLAKPKGGVNITVAPQFNAPSTVPLEKSTRTETQKEQIRNIETLSNLNDIESKTIDEYLTFWGKGKIAWAEFMDKLGSSSEEQRELIRNQTPWLLGVKNIFNAYRREITGAAAAMAELKDLESAIINTNMGPEKFKAALAMAKEKAKRAIRLRNSLLTSGLSTEDPDFSAKLDEMYRTGMDAKSGDDGARMAEYLVKQKGMSRGAALDLIRSYGYFDEDQQ